MFTENKNEFIFDNRVVSFSHAWLKYINGSYIVCHGSPEQNCLKTPSQVDQLLTKADIVKLTHGESTVIDIKFKINGEGRIKKILSIKNR